MLRRLNGRSGGEAGFTLIELLIVVLIVGVLAAVGVPLYLGYVRDARLAEGKALIGSVITAAQACAQGDPVNGCNLIQMRDKVGLTNTNNSGDNKWQVNQGGTNLTLDTANKTFSSGAVFTVAGVGGEVNGMAVTATSGGDGRFSLRCNVGPSATTATTTDPSC